MLCEAVITSSKRAEIKSYSCGAKSRRLEDLKPIPEHGRLGTGRERIEPDPNQWLSLLQRLALRGFS